MFTIGEFSKLTGLSIKTLRFYHDKGLIHPAHVDPETGYRYYNQRTLDRARVVVALRDLDFPLTEIQEILENYDDEADILDHLDRRRRELEAEIRRGQDIAAVLSSIISHEREAKRTMSNSTFRIEEKKLEPMLIAGVRMKGKYSDCAKGFSLVCRKFGRYMAGKPFCLYYDAEYQEDGADFEACVPIKKAKQTAKQETKQPESISVRTLSGEQCVALLHKGPYDQLTRSYEKVFSYIKDHGYQTKLPSREEYLKGPGMIFKGNPVKYLTEIQIVIEEL